MKLVDILFVLAVATTANAILIPIDNNGSLQTSRTLSQVSGPTDEPNPGTSNEYQQEPVDLSLPGRIRQQPMDQPNPNTPGPNQRPTVIVFGPNILKQGRKRIIEQPSSSTPSQVPDPIDQVGPNTFDKYQQQPGDKTSSGIPDQTQQHLMDATDLNIFDKDQQQPIDQPSQSTPKQSRKRPIGDSSPSGAPKRDRKQPIDQPDPSTSDEYWKPLFDIINPNIPSQDPVDEPSPSTSGKYWGPLFVIINPSTSSQDQQQPMGQGESANTVSNQIAGLSEQYQRTYSLIKQRLKLSKKIQNNKWQEYRRYVDLEFEQQMTLAMGKEISGSRYDPNVQKQLKQEYRDASKRVHSVKKQLRQFMKRRGLKFQEPDSD
ncbi:hypothetical protein BATDEDRAFT_88474 [Batrachochytrium dendrobatidis JAM81]|uniref:Uncharacterized protein n=1 Tax=Batrachochytrium dendrobatidis (strain JAM81 / FGSC 10211) TaxID=684364 RepID=F4P2B1_BATDJ|nr:uncharacterized protein BATDEDRAFT_88474 [Batrachochytrium dendrobatidis JAM81]EGF80827.1 hypothetical protein BATDEDRAFT_88474 [Batrachochytrium dendrobatidis JAM81]KAK5669098.1 hypothetical protein QVD99_004860 [Batrachochytrium dendrobatidis]|eukprot:XP_006678714.1 hypothetical protein BATDEDRAFT_88474 [Batrachochytrium dendrobatidis JAM81]